MPGVRAQAPGWRASRRPDLPVRGVRPAPQGAGTVPTVGDGVGEARRAARSGGLGGIDRGLPPETGSHRRGGSYDVRLHAHRAAGVGTGSTTSGGGRGSRAASDRAAAASPRLGRRARSRARRNRLGRPQLRLAERGRLVDVFTGTGGITRYVRVVALAPVWALITTLFLTGILEGGRCSLGAARRPAPTRPDAWRERAPWAAAG